MQKLKCFFLFCSFLIIFAIPDHVYAQDHKPPVFFYVPHQDDELLTMGHAIAHHVNNGYEVHVVLLTDGASSNAIHNVNRELAKYYLQPLTRQEFSYARNLEFVRALSKLGVERKHMHLSYMEDGGTSVDEIKRLVLQYVSRYPEAKHYAMSYTDDHIDHRNSGLALLELFEEGVIERPKFYIQNVERPLYAGENEPDVDLYYPVLKEAAKPYLDWYPLWRLYSIGNISVKGHFDVFFNNPTSKYHWPESYKR